MSLSRDLARYVVAHRRFWRKVQQPGGVRWIGNAPDYERLERCYHRLTDTRPIVGWLTSKPWGMRIILSWIN